MALVLKLSQSITNYTSLNLTDASGVYNVSTNPTGWGAPNIALSAVQYAHLIVTAPSGTIYDVDIVSDLGIDFSTVTYDELIYNLPYTLFGGTTGDLLPDGIWNIDYRISTELTWVEETINTYSLVVNIMTYYVIQEAVYNRIKLIPTYYTCSDCNNQFVKETSTIFMLLQALIASTQYSNTVRFTEILSALTDIMSFDTTNSSSCGC
jgi:hypothetical protein